MHAHMQNKLSKKFVKLEEKMQIKLSKSPLISGDTPEEICNEKKRALDKAEKLKPMLPATSK